MGTRSKWEGTQGRGEGGNEELDGGGGGGLGRRARLSEGRQGSGG